MRKLLFDATATQAYPGIKFHGGGEYAKFMLDEMIDCGYEFDAVIDDRRDSDPVVINRLNTDLKGRLFHVNSRTEIYDIINREGYEIFYSALPYDYTDYNCRARLIAVIHGLRRPELPWDYYRYKYFSNPLKRVAAYVVSNSRVLREFLRRRYTSKFRQLLSVAGARFITVSNHSKYSLLNFFPNLDADSVEVCYSPFELEEAVQNVRGDYFLMVSGNRFEKNIYRAVKAFDKLFSDGRLEGKRVVITGCDKLAFSGEIVNHNRFELLPYVDEEKLKHLYREAFCFVYPSLNEGFGYPPLLAMSYGVPVVASASTSIPEACGDASLYFCPTDINDICNRLLQIYYDETLRCEMVEKGYIRVAELQRLQSQSIPLLIEKIFN